MINSIKYFEEECISRFEKLENDFLKNPEKLAEYVLGLTDELHKLGLEMIKESLESMDRMIQDSPVRLKKWVVETHSIKQLTTSLGDVRFRKTLFTNKKTGCSEYLLDRILGLEPGERITEDAEAKLLEEAVQTSYRRGGEKCSMEEARGYILSNWTAAKLRLKRKDGVVGSSTEGHVSHVLSERMSSRPMGWSVRGAEKMSQLRAYYLNGGDMLELVRFQKKKLPKAAGSEYDVLSGWQVMESERNRHGELGKYVESITHSMSLKNKKIVYFNSHIWGL